MILSWLALTKGNLQKLQTLFEDVFEEADNLPVHLGEEGLSSSKFFSAIAKNGSEHLLSLATIERMIRYILRVQSSRKRHTQLSGEDTAWDVDALKRILRLLARRVEEVNDSVIFPADKAGTADRKSKGASRKTKKSATTEQPPVTASGATEGESEEPSENDHMNDNERADLEIQLDTWATAGLAARCVLLILDCEGLAKPLYSEDLLSSCLRLLKEHISQLLFPLLDGLAGASKRQNPLQQPRLMSRNFLTYFVVLGRKREIHHAR